VSEIRPERLVERYRWYCPDCDTEHFFRENEVMPVNTKDDPTTSSGACKVCGGNRWREETLRTVIGGAP
jgi:phage terminase large subunit GpA-like protein